MPSSNSSDTEHEDPSQVEQDEWSQKLAGIPKDKFLSFINALDLSLIHISEPTRPY